MILQCKSCRLYDTVQLAVLRFLNPGFCVCGGEYRLVTVDPETVARIVSYLDANNTPGAQHIRALLP